MKKIFFLLVATLAYSTTLVAQPTFPQNGIYDTKEGYVAFTNATIYISYDKKIENATLVIHNGTVESVAANGAIPKGAAAVDCTGKTIYPSFIDMFSSYGLPDPKAEGSALQQRPQMLSNKKGAFSWNEALKAEFKAADAFLANDAAAKELREIGFGAVCTHRSDGISRGSAAIVTLGNDREHLEIVRDLAAHVLSFKKGSSTQDYPSSLMGSIALLRQAYLDADWYKKTGASKEFNASLAAWNTLQNMPQIFDARDLPEQIRADKVAKEFKTTYILKGLGTEYRRLEELKATGASVIIPLNFPLPFDVEDPYDALNVSLTDLKHWELAPANAAFLAKANINFAFTSSYLKDKKDFLKNLRKAIKSGLTKTAALRALTATPAELLKINEQLGSLEKGKIANLLIATGDIFDEKTTITENWTHGKQFLVNRLIANDLRGTYQLNYGNKTSTMEVTGTAEKPEMKLLGNDTTKLNITYKINDKLLTLTFVPDAKEGKAVALSGSIAQNGTLWSGNGTLPNGTWTTWRATRSKGAEEKKDDKKDDKKAEAADTMLGAILYPLVAFGNEKIPTAETVLIKNATVWTNEKEGILAKADVLIEKGKIAAIGANLPLPEGAKSIDATGKHLTSGIIDEHSHIAISSGVNDGAQESSAEVRIGDVVNSEDINIYRQLAGGVTASQLLHGSANPIGGQSALIKLRWGYAPEKMKIAGADGFIKFALGENVKQSNAGDEARVRYPQTRMGVEQVYRDYFARAKAYAEDKDPNKRRDLDLETLAEILAKKRFITCHSYVQSEILMLMKVAEDFDFRINTFTHILEGYKVAPQMKAHGVNASTFADWWGYKMEVQEAIPYNGAILHEQGVNVAFNSDDAEMGRRLNQEAAKAVQFGGVKEEDAWKFVTLNPAKMLHLDKQTGSVAKGKDADLVLWSANPLSVYARAELTFVDGIRFFDRADDSAKQKTLQQERNRIVQKMIKEKADGKATQTVVPKKQKLDECDTVENYD